jgi:hypothetical protein
MAMRQFNDVFLAFPAADQPPPAPGAEAPRRQGARGGCLFSVASGAKVFSAGAIRWAWGLGKPGFENEAFKRFNANLALDFLR